jgi:hypothetical protein
MPSNSRLDKRRIDHLLNAGMMKELWTYRKRLMHRPMMKTHRLPVNTPATPLATNAVNAVINERLDQYGLNGDQGRTDLNAVFLMSLRCDLSVLFVLSIIVEFL